MKDEKTLKDPGRVTPPDYHLSLSIFKAEPALSCDTLIVAGGVYGNPFALDALDELVVQENGKLLVVLNGDIHWFDKSAENFSAIEERIRPYLPLIGNVEAELRRVVDIGAGCGCSYPECTSDAAVSRSNNIHYVLSSALAQRFDLKALLEERLPAVVVNVGGKKVGISHGDEKLISGWGCSRESLQEVTRQAELDCWMVETGVDILTTTHTCAPVAIKLKNGIVINNGASGMPNFSGQKHGLIVRISINAFTEPVFSAHYDDIFVEAIPLYYNHEGYLAWFDQLWPALSPASLSYRDRIINGPDDSIENALLGGFSIGRGFKNRDDSKLLIDII